MTTYRPWQIGVKVCEYTLISVGHADATPLCALFTMAAMELVQQMPVRKCCRLLGSRRSAALRTRVGYYVVPPDQHQTAAASPMARSVIFSPSVTDRSAGVHCSIAPRRAEVTYVCAGCTESDDIAA